MPVVTTPPITGTTTSQTTPGMMNYPTGRTDPPCSNSPITSHPYQPLPTVVPPQTSYGTSGPSLREECHPSRVHWDGVPRVQCLQK
uniref:Uncharacterized protein n=1 Tax=Bracon brevicornis TaxID=1563983 RepID=A0A6V7JQD1_9HYME